MMENKVHLLYLEAINVQCKHGQTVWLQTFQNVRETNHFHLLHGITKRTKNHISHVGRRVACALRPISYIIVITESNSTARLG